MPLRPRQRFLLVDTLGLLLSVKVVPANTAETVAAMRGLGMLGESYEGVRLAWADQGFGGAPFRTWLKDILGWDLELTSGISKPGQSDFEVAPRRWVADRPHGAVRPGRRRGPLGAVLAKTVPLSPSGQASSCGQAR